MKKAGLTVALCSVALAVTSHPASAQAGMPSGDGATQQTDGPFRVATFGVFRKMLSEGDFTPKVPLAAVMAKQPTTGVGAVADARGEITVFDGKLIVSYGKPAAQTDPSQDSAALLTFGSAPAWQSIAVKKDVAPAEIETFIASTAKAYGLDPEQSFPFEIEGTILSYVMHVNIGPTNGPHGMGYPIAVTNERKGERIEGRVAGLYVAARLMGIATHGGERTHAHWVAADGAATAHLDRWGLAAGAILRLPKP